MTVGIVGLGLIGGSMAKAYAEAGDTVLGFDTDEATLSFSKVASVVRETLDEQNVGDCDLILLAVCPSAAIDWLKKYAPHIRKDTIVLDCCGTKRVICAACMPIAKEYGFTFVGGHPMAGTQFAGFKNSYAKMFRGAPMVIVPPSFDDIRLLERVKELLAPLGFGRFSVTTAEAHDEMIAFTSQMAHVVSSAYIKSPTAELHKGFSAGSYKDMTRVARLNPDMWAELFLENGDRLLYELDTFLGALRLYRDAIADNDFDTLRALLEEGRRRKEEVDG
jgi:prephenate dehydrogenase